MGAKVTYIETLRNVAGSDGLLSLYRGSLAAGSGSIVFRATGFAVFELFFTKWEKQDNMRWKIPYTGGIEFRTAAAGVMSGSFRALLECPFEYAKVKRQTG